MAPPRTDPAASMALLRDLMRDDAGLDYADAAARKAAGPTTPHRRTSWAVVATAVLVAGILAIGLVQRQVQEPQALVARDALVQRAQEAQTRTDALEAEVAAQRAELGALQESLIADTAEGEALTARIGGLEELAGYTAVTGPGFVVVLDDAKGIDRTDPSEPGRVLDRDVQTAVNGLWEAGAEAVAVNGRRLTATTAIRTAGSAILVDFKPLLPPYRVEAIGNPATLPGTYSATRSAEQLRTLVESYGLRITSDAVDSVTLAAATALLPVRARVPGPGGVTVAPSPSGSTTGGSS